jgi:hypothetical protein
LANNVCFTRRHTYIYKRLLLYGYLDAYLLFLSLIRNGYNCKTLKWKNAKKNKWGQYNLYLYNGITLSSSLFVLLSFFAIVIPVFLRITASDYPVGISNVSQFSVCILNPNSVTLFRYDTLANILVYNWSKCTQKEEVKKIHKFSVISHSQSATCFFKNIFKKSLKIPKG